MKSITVLCVFSCAFLALSSANSLATSTIFCYFESWTVYRPGNGKFDVDNIDPSLCTHICFTFLGINTEDGSINILDPWESNDDGGYQGFRRLVSLKQSNPGLKVLVSMGGWNEGSAKYSQVAASPTKRANLAKQVLAFIEEHGFDGFDLDWEYPARRDSDNAADRENFNLLLQELSNVLKPKGYLLSVAVAGAQMYIDVSYNVTELLDIVDYANIMAYDFHGAFDDYVGHHTPLYASHLDTTDEQKNWNVAAGVEGWLSRGANAAKLNLGIATYGRSFTLQDPNNDTLYAPNIGGGLAGPYTRQDGILGYNEICELHSNWTYVWDDEQMVPHRKSGNQWVGYEDQRSIEIKVRYANEKGLGGFMVWSFDTDDFRGLCGNGTYPLIRTISETLATI